MANWTYVLLVLVSATTVLRADTKVKEDDSGDVKMTLEEVLADNARLMKELAGEEECFEKRNVLVKENQVLRNKVDKDTPQLEKMTKDATDKVTQVIADAARWRMNFILTSLALVATWAKTVSYFFNEGLQKAKSLLKNKTEEKSQKSIKKRK